MEQRHRPNHHVRCAAEERCLKRRETLGTGGTTVISGDRSPRRRDGPGPVRGGRPPRARHERAIFRYFYPRVQNVEDETVAALERIHAGQLMADAMTHLSPSARRRRRPRRL